MFLCKNKAETTEISNQAKNLVQKDANESC